MASSQRPPRRPEDLLYQQRKMKVVSSPSVPVPVVYLHLDAPMGQTEKVVCNRVLHNAVIEIIMQQSQKLNISTTHLYLRLKWFKIVQKENKLFSLNIQFKYTIFLQLDLFH